MNGDAFLWFFVGVSAIVGTTLLFRNASIAVMSLTLLTVAANLTLDRTITTANWLQIIPLALLVRELGLDMIGFGPDRALYIVDFGITHIAPEAGAIRQQIGTGSLWRIRRVECPQGLVPPERVKVPLYVLQGATIAAVIVGVGVVATLFLRRIRSGRNGNHS